MIGLLPHVYSVDATQANIQVNSTSRLCVCGLSSRCCRQWVKDRSIRSQICLVLDHNWCLVDGWYCVWFCLIKTNLIIDEIFYWRCPYCLSLLVFTGFEFETEINGGNLKHILRQWSLFILYLLMQSGKVILFDYSSECCCISFGRTLCVT